ncbi:sensor histidine kinase [Bacillus sp. es.036]|uniref:sensor histidine kinase n=1 Tax=Bacillus sp. es.036 TaxID=1761764 RepID=UPI000BF9EF7E|nr:sensor histidine kinase [Bacillus sp. es.036]PFG12361.1 two-component system, OmpR family, bacitracin resistance sensor histidine kinase BceS [Bacillus sp. es.036]
MMWRFFKERRSWILFILFIEACFLLITYVDATIPFTSMLYAVFLTSLLFFLFLGLRFVKETKFYQELEDRETNFDITSIPQATSPFEKVVEQVTSEQIEQLKDESSHMKHQLEVEKDDLITWIHEVKTPLTALHLLMDRVADRELNEQLTYEWLRIHFLLDQQLHHKRMPAIENDLYIEKVNLEQMLVDEITPLRTWCKQRGIGFDLDLNVTELLSDAKWLAFMLRQLLTNAVKYSENSDISIVSKMKDNQPVLLIKDKGRGIMQRDLPRIFEKGFTSTANHQDSAATGMGLYLTRKIADHLKVNINVISEPGMGTTFTLTFPERNDFDQIRGM